MKQLVILSVSLIYFSSLFSANVSKEKKFVEDNIKFASEQTALMLKTVGDPAGKYPRSINKEGKLVFTGMYDWTPGFFPGTLWYLYELTGEKMWETEAEKWTHSLEKLKTFTGHHDLGFMMYCSYGNEYRLQPNESDKEILIESAKSLSTRFNPVTKTIKSWNYRKAWDGKTEWFFPVIIDNMMNLEMLFFASKVSGDKRFYDIAVTHANTTIKNHLRPDYSSYHVVDYDSITGVVKDQATCQGFSDNSTWARGQAWGIYGFTVMYRETKDPAYLKVAKGMADWYLKRLPKDKIPYWDFNVGQKGYTAEWKYNASDYPVIPRDASAAAIVSSALFDLYQFTKEKKYVNAAIEMLHSLGSPSYRAPLGENGNFILMHSVGSIPHGAEINVPLVYADYYFIEALKRYKQFLERN